MRLDESAALVRFVANVGPGGSAELTIAENPLEQRESATAAIFEVPLGRPLTHE